MPADKTSPLKSLPFDQPVIFFDGHCNLCNGFVDFVFRHDQRQCFLLASLQGKTASEYLPAELTKTLVSVVVVQKEKIWTESSAALKVLSDLPWPFPIFGVFQLVPKFLRDPLYRFIAKNRYQWFGRRDTCRRPTPEEKQRFLD